MFSGPERLMSSKTYRHYENTSTIYDAVLFAVTDPHNQILLPKNNIIGVCIATFCCDWYRNWKRVSSEAETAKEDLVSNIRPKKVLVIMTLSFKIQSLKAWVL